MSTIAEQLQEAADKASQASAQAGLWTTGPVGTTVPTESGPVPTIAEFTRAAQERADDAIDALGWVLAGDFTAGCTVTDRNQYVLVVGGACYRWDGVLPKVVAPGSSPTPIATGAWVLVGDATFSYTFKGPDYKGLDNFFGGGGWTPPNSMDGSIYNTTGATYTNASRWRFALQESEVTKDPTIWLNKRTALSRDDGVNRWDSGNVYAALDKISGNAYGASATFVARHFGGAGDMIGIHGRGYGYHGAAKVWGGWSYASSRPNPDGSPITENVTDLIAHEFNLCNLRGDVSWTPALGKGIYRGIVVNTADGSGTAHVGVDVGAQTSSGSKPWYVGVRVRANGIVAYDQPEGDRAVGVLIEGASALSARYGGIALRGAALHYGIDMSEVTTIDNNAAMVFKDDHRIRWGSRTTSRYISANSSTALFNFNNYSVGVNGVKILGERQVGFSRMTGTPLKTSFNADTATLTQVAQRLKAIEDALHADSGHGLYGLT